jgi:2-polyprenyl-3-methyl-5-hydroxy-6-metoxy-1,4-benzoquinol methylase
LKTDRIREGPFPGSSISEAGMMRSDEKCRLCGSKLASNWFIAWDHEIYACSQCGFLFAIKLAGAPAPNYESGYHSDFIERDMKADTLERYEALLKELGSMAPGRRLLDIGCGAGGFLNFARSLGWSVSGIDGSQAAVQHALNAYRLDATVADLNRHELQPGDYDVIWSFHVIEHLSDPLHLIRSAAAALVPNGLIFIGTPFYSRARIRLHQLLYKIGAAHYPFDFNLPDHISYFGMRTLRALCSTVGLEIVRTWFSGKRTLSELAAAARRSGGTRKTIGNAMLPFEKVLRNIGSYQNINVIARKKQHR